MNVVGTIDTSGTAGQISASVLLTSCPSGKEVEVRTYDNAGVPADRPFFILVN